MYSQFFNVYATDKFANVRGTSLNKMIKGIPSFSSTRDVAK